MNQSNVSVPQEMLHPGVFSAPSFQGHEQVVFCHDKASGLKAIIGIHDTTLGPALGGTRMWDYANEGEALRDVLRLSRGMTYKVAISGLALGGGKAVIIGNSQKDKSPELMRAFGDYVNSLGGRYITAEDVGINPQDMTEVKKRTDHVTGIPQEMGGSGDPSPVTAYGTFMGMKAAAKYRYGSDDLAGKKILVQGIGHVGAYLVKHLAEAGALVTVNDIHEERMEEMARQYGAQILRGDELFSTAMDIYAPCALGATVNPLSIPKMSCDIIAGAANNQLAGEVRDGEALREAGILYAPDFLINAGGLINVNSEIAKYDRAEALRRTENIYDTSLAIFRKAELENITTHQAALALAEARIAEAKALSAK